MKNIILALTVVSTCFVSNPRAYASINILPPEVMHHIGQYVMADATYKDMGRFAMTCKAWLEIATDPVMKRKLGIVVDINLDDYTGHADTLAPMLASNLNMRELNIKSSEMSDFISGNFIPALVNLPHLIALRIFGKLNVTQFIGNKVGSDWYQIDSPYLPSLKQLKILEIGSVIGFCRADDFFTTEIISELTNLEVLAISGRLDFDRLKKLPSLRNITNFDSSYKGMFQKFTKVDGVWVGHTNNPGELDCLNRIVTKLNSPAIAPAE